MTTTPAPTDLDPETLKALEQAATPAPWAVSEGGYIVRDTDGAVVAEAYGAKDVADAAFVTAVRNAYPVLSERLTEQAYELSQVHEDNERLSGELAEAKREIRALTETDDAQVVIARAERDAAREELAKTRAELDGLKALLEQIGPITIKRGRETEHGPMHYGPALAQLANPATTAEPAANLPCHCPDGRRVPYCLVHGEKATAEPATEPTATCGIECTELPPGTHPLSGMHIGTCALPPGHDGAHNPDAKPAAPKATHGFTTHGHHCCELAPVGERPNRVARCGGTRMCRDCKDAANRIHGAGPAAS